MPSGLPNPALLPFVVAATGHRDLRPGDRADQVREIRKVFADMRDLMPNTPLLLLSGLAQGADQLIAEIALEHDVLLAAVLPMPLDIFRTTMPVDDAANLDTLLAQAALQIVLPLDGRTSEEIRASESVRSECYEALARFLARHGQALIALWDGHDSTRLGGTASIVHYVRSGVLNRSEEETESRCGVVYHVVTPRLSTAGSAPTVETHALGCEISSAINAAPTLSSTLSADCKEVPYIPRAQQAGEQPRRTDRQQANFAQLEANIERFNREAARLAAQTSAPRSHLIADPNIPLSAFLKRLDTVYGLADAISIRANLRRKRYLLSILLTAVSGTVFYGIHGEMFDTNVWLWFTFPAFIIIALALHYAARRGHIEEEYLDARALAEALRVQFFWQMAGVAHPVDRFYLMDRRTELDWIRFALKNIWLLHQGVSEDTSVKPKPRVVLESWVKDQARWYRRKACLQGKSVHRREVVSRIAIGAAVLWSILVPLSLKVHGPWYHIQPWSSLGPIGHINPDNRIFKAFHVALAIPAILAGAYRLWIEQAGYEEQSREYRFMEHQFTSKAKELEEHLDNPELAAQLLKELGIEALKENGRWLLLHRERPLEIFSST